MSEPLPGTDAPAVQVGEAVVVAVDRAAAAPPCREVEIVCGELAWEVVVEVCCATLPASAFVARPNAVPACVPTEVETECVISVSSVACARALAEKAATAANPVSIRLRITP